MTPTWDETNPVDAAEPAWEDTTPAEVGALDTSKLKISPYEQAKLEGRDEGPYAGGEGARQRNLEEAGALYASLLEPPMRIPRIEAKSTLGKLAAAPVNVASGLLESVASPVGALTLPMLEVKAAAPILKGVFGSLAVRDAAQRLGEASVTRDPGQAAEGFLTGALGGIALPEGTLAGLYRAAKSPIERARIDRTIRRAEEAVPPREPIPEAPIVPDLGITGKTAEEAIAPPETPIEEPKGETPNATLPVGEPTPLSMGEAPGSSEEVGARVSGAEEPTNAQGDVPKREQVSEEVAEPEAPPIAPEPVTASGATETPPEFAKPAVEPTKGLTQSESERLAYLTDKVEINAKLTAKDRKQFTALKEKVRGIEPEPAQVESGMEGPGSPSITQPPDPATMGLDTGSPIYNRIKAH